MRTGSMRFGKPPPSPKMPAQPKPTSPAMPSGAASKAATGAYPGLLKGKGKGKSR